MEIYYYSHKSKNFGDELNTWMWPKLFSQIGNKHQNVRFVGIGTILDSRLDGKNKKIIFGTGIRSLNTLPKIDSSFDIRFVRGPISSYALSNYNVQHISDPAICLGLLEFENIETVDRVGFMPHFHTANTFNCQKICKLAGVHFIDPRKNIESVLREIRTCKRIIAEAMHGAIVADVFRIPWIRVMVHSWQIETPEVSTLKWLDWGLSMGVNSSAHILSTLPIKNKKILSSGEFYLKSYFNKPKVVKGLSEIKMKDGLFRLSKESHYERVLLQVKAAIEKVKNDYFL